MRIIVDEYTDCTRGERRATLVHHSQHNETLLLLADASETAFSRGYQPLIDVVKASFMDSLIHGAGSLKERMRNASRATEKTIRERFVNSSEFGEESYSAVFVALGLKEWTASPLWIGSPQSKLLLGGVCERATSPEITAMPHSRLIVTNNSIRPD